MAEGENALAYDSSGRMLKDAGYHTKSHHREPSPVWPPMGYNLVFDIPGHSIRDQWPRGEGKAQVMNRDSVGGKDMASQIADLSKLRDQGKLAI